MRREKITPEEWRERLDRAVNAKRGRWRVLPRAMASSRAFAELSKAGLIVVLAMLDNLTYKGKSKKSRNGLECCGLPLDNYGEFVITNNELVARGLKSPDSITRGRREAWTLGFYDVVKTGSLMNYGIYRYSERWKNFPDGDYLPSDQRLPGKCLYPREKKSQTKPTTENVVSTTTENVVKGDESVTTENVVIETGSPTTESVVNIIMYQQYQAEVQVQEKDREEDPAKQFPQGTLCPNTERANQDNQFNSASDNNTIDPKPDELQPPSIQHQWFIDSFLSARSETGIDASPALSPALASALDAWLSNRLSKKTFIGNRCFYAEKPNHIKEKIQEIVSEWESLRKSGLGKRIGVPPVPDLAFLVTNREAIFNWVTELRRRSLDAVFAQFETNEQDSHAGYAHRYSL